MQYRQLSEFVRPKGKALWFITYRQFVGAAAGLFIGLATHSIVAAAVLTVIGYVLGSEFNGLPATDHIAAFLYWIVDVVRDGGIIDPASIYRQSTGSGPRQVMLRSGETVVVVR